MSEIPSVPTTPPSSAVKFSYTTDTSKLGLTFSLVNMQKSINDVTNSWNEDNLNLSAEAKMWQYRNQNVGKILELTEIDSNMSKPTTIQIPTKDGKPLDNWKQMPDDQKEATWKEAISGYKYEKNAEGKWVMARDASGQLIESDLKLGEVSMGGWNFMQDYEGMKDRAYNKKDGSDDTIRSRNQTHINNIMSINSNKLSQATTQSSFGIQQLNAAVNTTQQLFNELFSTLKQFSNNISA